MTIDTNPQQPSPMAWQRYAAYRPVETAEETPPQEEAPAPEAKSTIKITRPAPTPKAAEDIVTAPENA